MSTQPESQQTASFTSHHDPAFTPTEAPDDDRSFSKQTTVEGVTCKQHSGSQTVQSHKRELNCSPVEHW